MILSPNLIWILIAISIFTIASSHISIYVNLNKQILISDVLAHATLPGVMLSYILFENRDPIILLIFAILSALSAKFFYNWIVNSTIIKPESAQAILIAIYFAAGLLCMSYLQKYSAGNKSGLDHILFGQITGVVPKDLMIITCLSVIAYISSLVVQRRLTLIIFDKRFYKLAGVRIDLYEVYLTVVITALVSLGLQLIGVILISALLIIPYSIATLWVKTLKGTRFFVLLISLTAGIAGILISSKYSIPAGPGIVLILSGFYIVSFILGARSGELWKFFRRRKQIAKSRQENILRSIYKSQELQKLEMVSKSIAHAFINSDYSIFERDLKKLHENKLIKISGDYINLTSLGKEYAERLTRYHRLWESYLIEKLHFKEDHVHSEAEIAEHYFSEDLASLIQKELSVIKDPHGRKIPELKND